MGVAAENGSNGTSNSSFSGELVPEENFLGICSREFLARGCELLKRTRKGKKKSLRLVLVEFHSDGVLIDQPFCYIKLKSYSGSLVVSTFQLIRWLI